MITVKLKYLFTSRLYTVKYYRYSPKVVILLGIRYRFRCQITNIAWMKLFSELYQTLIQSPPTSPEWILPSTNHGVTALLNDLFQVVFRGACCFLALSRPFPIVRLIKGGFGRRKTAEKCTARIIDIKQKSKFLL